MGWQHGKKIAAGAATAGLVAGGSLAITGVASAAPATGSADAVVDIVNQFDLGDVAQSDDVQAPDLDVTVNNDDTVTLDLTNPNTENWTACTLAVTSAFDAPADGVVTWDVVNNAAYPVAGDDGEVDPDDFFTTDDLSVTTQALDAGIYAASSNCTAWESGQAFMDGDDPIGTTANQPYYFFTLGDLGESLS